MSQRTIEYQEERLRRAIKRKTERKINRKNKKYRYGKQICPDCGGYMTWCTGCEMWSKICCEEYGTCMCS